MIGSFYGNLGFTTHACWELYQILYSVFMVRSWGPVYQNENKNSLCDYQLFFAQVRNSFDSKWYICDNQEWQFLAHFFLEWLFTFYACCNYALSFTCSCGSPQELVLMRAQRIAGYDWTMLWWHNTNVFSLLTKRKNDYRHFHSMMCIYQTKAFPHQRLIQDLA